MIRLLRRSKVPWVLLENVKGLLSSIKVNEDADEANNDPAPIEFVYQQLEELGYNVASRVVSLPGFGIPHARDRVFILASLYGGIFCWGSKAKVCPRTAPKCVMVSASSIATGTATRVSFAKGTCPSQLRLWLPRMLHRKQKLSSTDMQLRLFIPQAHQKLVRFSQLPTPYLKQMPSWRHHHTEPEFLESQLTRERSAHRQGWILSRR